MKIKLISDIHLEFTDIDIKNEHGYDLLIMAGDILVADDLHDHPEPDVPYTDEEIKKLGKRQRAANLYRNFLKRVSNEFPQVIYIAGNHEFYHGKWHASLDHIREECEKFSNIHFLEDQSITINNVVFMGATLWTNCNKNDPLTLNAIQNAMNDFHLIRDDHKGFTKLRPAIASLRHQKSLEFFKKTLEENKEKTCVVVSHHAPSFLSVHERYAKEYLTNGAYASDLSEFILDHPQIKLWVHGHMHNVSDYMIGETRIVCNPRGYEGYEPDSYWNKEIILEV